MTERDEDREDEDREESLRYYIVDESELSMNERKEETLCYSKHLPSWHTTSEQRYNDVDLRV